VLVDLNLEGRNVIIFGGGIIGERKVRKFLEENSRIAVVSKRFTRGLKQLGQMGKVRLVESDLGVNPSSITSLMSNSDIVIVATDNQKLNENIAVEATRLRTLVSVVDNPSISSFCLPATARFGEIRVAIGTGGRSPAMARILRKRLEKVITSEDILQVELQHYARALVKAHIPNRKSRRSLLYRIIKNPKIRNLLKEGNLEGAKNFAKQIIEHQ